MNPKPQLEVCYKASTKSFQNAHTVFALNLLTVVKLKC